MTVAHGGLSTQGDRAHLAQATPGGEANLSSPDVPDVDAAKRTISRAAVRPHYVYVAVSASGAVLYAGSTGTPGHRLASHMGGVKAGSPWWPEAASIMITRYPDMESGLKAEAERIATLQPLHNTHLRGGSPRDVRQPRYGLRRDARLKRDHAAGIEHAERVGCSDCNELLEMWLG